jgi:hypothetical protein
MEQSNPTRYSPKSGAVVSDVPAGNASRLLAKVLYRLSVPLRWYRHSIVRRVAEEVRNFPRRIAAVLAKPFLAWGPTIPLCPVGDSPENFCEVNSWLLACSDDIRQLSNEYPWLGALDFEACFQSYALGAGWYRDNRCSCTGRNNAEAQSFHNPLTLPGDCNGRLHLDS